MKLSGLIALLFCLVFLSSATLTGSGAPQGGYHLLKKIP